MKTLLAGRVAVACLGLLLMMGVGADAQNNIVVNGSFESPGSAGFFTNGSGLVPGWTAHEAVTCGGALPQEEIELWNSASFVAQDQAHHLEISSNFAPSSVCQTIAGLRTDCPTTFSFWYAGRPDFGSISWDNTFTVTLSGGLGPSIYSATLAPDPYDPPNTGWLQHAISFYPPSTSLTMQFSRDPTVYDIGGAHIDNVTLTQACPISHFTCSGVRKVAYVYQGFQVSLEDRFVSGGASVVVHHTLLCAPTNKNGEDPHAPSRPGHLHLHKFQGLPPNDNDGVLLEDQFGTETVDVRGARWLLVPTSKVLSPPPVAPPSDVAHFLCHRIRKHGGGPLPDRENITIEDQFGQSIVSMRADRLCAPANKNNEDPAAPRSPNLLTCHRIKPVSQLPVQTTVWTASQFGNGREVVKTKKMVCVPSRIRCHPVCQDGTNVGQPCDDSGDCGGFACQAPPCCCSPDGKMPCSGDGECTSNLCECQ